MICKLDDIHHFSAKAKLDAKMLAECDVSDGPVTCSVLLQTQVGEVMAECNVSEESVTCVPPLQDELGRLQTQVSEVTAENETLTAQLGEVSHVTTAAAPVVTQGSTAGAGEQQTHLETITKVW